MYDTINFRITELEAGGVDFLKVVPPCLDNVGGHLYDDEPFITGSLNGLKVVVSRFQVKVKDGSICKFALGNNFQTMGRQDTQRAIEQLSDTLHLPMDKATITRLDIAQNFIMKYPPQVYYNHLGQLRNTTRLQEPDGIYYNFNGGRLCFYDKVKEQATHKEAIPDLYKGKNVVRYEQRFTKRLPQRFGKQKLTAKSLFDEAFYIEVLNGWRDVYLQIQKINDITLNFEAMKTKQDLYKMGVLSLIERAGGELEIIAQIKEAQRRGDITSKQAFDLRSVVKNVCTTKAGLVVQNEAIKELDKKVIEAVRFYR